MWQISWNKIDVKLRHYPVGMFQTLRFIGWINTANSYEPSMSIEIAMCSFFV